MNSIQSLPSATDSGQLRKPARWGVGDSALDPQLQDPGSASLGVKSRNSPPNPKDSDKPDLGTAALNLGLC